jgi:ERCC4-type nuclease
VSPNYSRKSEKRRSSSSSKSRRDDGVGGEDPEERERKKRRRDPQESADGAEEAEPVVKFLLKEGCVKSVKVLEVGDGMYVCMQLLHSVLSLSLSLTDL